MDVTFTKLAGRRYGVDVHRERAPDLWIRPAPGYDDYVPHDLLHFVAEAELGLDGGVFGDLAAGGNARIFVPVDRRLVAQTWRRKRKQAPRRSRLPDGRRSELLAGLLDTAWKAAQGHHAFPSDWDARLAAAGVSGGQLDAVASMLDQLAGRWHALPPGASITLTWPRPERRRRPSRPAVRRG